MTVFNNKIDYLKMYFGDPMVVTDKIIITQPSIQDIIDYDESRFWGMLSIFITNPTTHRLELWENGIDWNKFTDYQLFMRLAPVLSQEDTELILGDLDLSTFNEYEVHYKDDPDKVTSTFYSEVQDIEITEDVFNFMALYVRTMVNMFPKVEKAKGRATKEAIIWEEKENLVNKKDDDKPHSILLPMISSALNHPGFKYKKEELRDVKIYEFIDSCQRLQVYESSTALLKGMYSGFVDSKKIDAKDYDFMRDLTIKTS